MTRMEDGEGNSAAPIQPITGMTGIVLILADPVRQITGSAIQNAFYQSCGLDAVAVPLHVPDGELARALATIRTASNIVGCHITKPHKTAIIDHLDSISDLARDLGAVNILRRTANGDLSGHNVDGLGFLAALSKSGIGTAGKRILLLGAGGAARAIGFALAGQNIGSLVIANRDIGRADALVSDLERILPATSAAHAAIDASGFDLIINATSVGTGGGTESPIATDGIRSGTAVADIIISPAITPLLRAAQQKGCMIMRGRSMLEEQLQAASVFLGLERRADRPAAVADGPA